tara:strand:- start:1703 stop:2089 length:387 start_codon:yes stop_codon:yes gene_type:complete
MVDNKKDNILISEDDYINNLNKNNINKNNNYYKTKYLIVYKFYNNNNKNYNNIIHSSNDNNLYTLPNSPYMFYNNMSEPDGYYNNIKRKEFIDKINNLSPSELEERVKEKRIKFINLINKLNKLNKNI